MIPQMKTTFSDLQTAWKRYVEAAYLSLRRRNDEEWEEFRAEWQARVAPHYDDDDGSRYSLSVHDFLWPDNHPNYPVGMSANPSDAELEAAENEESELELEMSTIPTAEPLDVSKLPDLDDSAELGGGEE